MDGKWSELWSPERRGAMATLSLGVALFAFNAFVVATALPAAVTDLGGSAWIAWATSLYLIPAIVTGTAAAAVMHRMGARRLFVLAGLVFLVGTLLAGLAPSMELLLAGRALQGAAAGFIESGCYVLIPQLFPPRLIAKVFGVEAVVWAAAAFGAPALAGVLTQTISWRAALLSTAPLALIFLALVPRVVRSGPDLEAVPGSAPGLPLLPLAGIAAGMALVLASSANGGMAWQAGMLAAGFAAFALTLRMDSRARVRLLPARAFGLGHAPGLGLWIVLLMPVAQSVQVVFANYVLQFLWGFTPLASGLSTSVLSLSWSGVQVLASHRPWPRINLVLAGLVLLVAGLALMALAFAGGGVPVLLAGLAVIGAAFGAGSGAVNQVMMEAAAPEDRDVTSGLLPTVSAAGYGLGAAVWGLVANSLGFSSASGEGLRVVTVQLFTLAILPALVALGLGVLMARALKVSR